MLSANIESALSWSRGVRRARFLSLKVRPTEISEGREVYVIHVTNEGGEPSEVVRRVAVSTRLDPHSTDSLLRLASSTDRVLVGIEGNGAGRTKVYLESDSGFVTRTADGTAPSIVAVKWRQSQPALWSWYTPARHPFSMHCVESAYGRGHATFVGCLEALAFRRGALFPTVPDHLVVSEPGTARRSFDVGVGDLGLTAENALAALHDHALASRLEHLPGIDPRRQGELPVSRIAGGIDGDGEPFVTVHYRAPLREHNGSDLGVLAATDPSS